MDCTRAEQLLPLRAGGDLEDGRESARLAAHLAGCVACRRLTNEWAEWAETVRLLRLDDAPEFDAAFFDPIRRDVMREITAKTTASGSPARPSLAALSPLLAGLLRPRTLAYAASLALVCAALFFALRPARAPRPSKLAGGGVAPGVNRQSSSERGTSDRAPRDAVAHEGARRKTGARGLPAHKDGRAPHESSAAAKKLTTPRAEDDAPSAPSPSIARGESPAVAPRPSAANVAAPGVIPAAVELAVVKDAREMMKIDLRTSDPDVRIIWFSPQPNAQTSPRSTNDKR